MKRSILEREPKMSDFTDEEKLELVKIGDQARWGNILRAQERLDALNAKVRARINSKR